MATLMIVEDEPLLLQIGAEVLGDAGYDIIEAHDADDALDLLEHHNDVALLFTDVRMPGSMDGLQLAARVHGLWPDIRLLVTSGHMQIADMDLPDHGEFLSKPYRWQDLTNSVERILSRSH